MTAIFPSSRPNISVRVIPKIPATMVGAGGIGVSKENGKWTIEPAWDDLALIAPGILLDPTSKELWVHDPVTDVYNRMTLGGLGQALFWGTSASATLIGAGSKTFTTQSGKDWLPGMFVQAFSRLNPVNFLIGQVTAYTGTTLTVNVLSTGGSGTYSDWTIVQSTLPGSGPPGATGAAGGLNYNFVAGLSGDPGSGCVGFNTAAIASINAIRVSHIDRMGINILAEVASWDDSTTTFHRAKIRVASPNNPERFVIAAINGLGVNGGTFTTFPLDNPVGTTLPIVGNCQVEIYRTGDTGTQGPAGVPGGVVTISETPPSLPIHGQEWWDSVSGSMYIYYNDGTSAQWVQTNGSVSDLIDEAPVDGTAYARQDAGWVPAAIGGGGDGVALVPEDFGALADGVFNDGPAIQACIDEAQISGRPVLLKSKYHVAENGSNGYCLLISKAIRMTGSGSRLTDFGRPFGEIVPLASVGSGVRIIKIRGTAHYALNFLHLEGFTVGSTSGFGSNAIYIDTTNDGPVMQGAKLIDLRCDSRSGIHSFLHDNTGSTPDTGNNGGFAAGLIKGGRYWNGIKFILTGPNNRVEGPMICLGDNWGVEATQISGATDFIVGPNVLIENIAGSVKFDNMTNCMIEDNSIEPPTTGNETLLDIGSSGPVNNCVIKGNTLIVRAETPTLLTSVRIGANAVNTILDSNFFNTFNPTQQASGVFIRNLGVNTDVRKNTYANTVMVAGDREITSSGAGLRLLPLKLTTWSGSADAQIFPFMRNIWLTGAVAGNKTLTLPLASTFRAGDVIQFKDSVGGISTNGTVTFARSGTDTIEGDITFRLSNPIAMLELMSDGVSKWMCGVLSVRQGGTGDTGGAWEIYTPTVTSNTAVVINSPSRQGYFKLIGKRLLINVRIPVVAPLAANTVNYLIATLPLGLTAARVCPMAYSDNNLQFGAAQANPSLPGGVPGIAIGNSSGFIGLNTYSAAGEIEVN